MQLGMFASRSRLLVPPPVHATSEATPLTLTPHRTFRAAADVFVLHHGNKPRSALPSRAFFGPKTFADEWSNVLYLSPFYSSLDTVSVVSKN